MATKKSSSDERPKLQSSHKKAAGASATGASRSPRASSASSAGRSVRKDDKAPTNAKKNAARALAKSVSKPASTKMAAPKPSLKVGPKSRREGNVPTESLASDNARAIAIEIASAALEKKAVGLEVLDVAGRVDYADYVVLMSGRSDRQVAALASAIEEALRKKGKKPLSIEGLPNATWVLMDFGDVVVHVFQEESRGLYDLEGLWMDAKRIPVTT